MKYFPSLSTERAKEVEEMKKNTQGTRQNLQKGRQVWHIIKLIDLRNFPQKKNLTLGTENLFSYVPNKIVTTRKKKKR